ncbi:MAG: hypothetical protein O7I93_11960 [Gemmatimonadetes bacterium]|nr:hypothetical protein [Gemmatimonadota bacterium]
MDNIGIDLHQRESQLCILTEEGELIERRIRTTAARFTEVLGGRPKVRILLEASTESEPARDPADSAPAPRGPNDHGGQRDGVPRLHGDRARDQRVGEGGFEAVEKIWP